MTPGEPVELTWLVVQTDKPNRLAKWKRSVGVSPEGKIYVPAVIAGSEMMVLMCAGWDGTELLLLGKPGHLYVPADWMAREFPKTTEAIAKITKMVRAFDL